MTRSLLRMTRLDSPASCVDYSPDGELMVVGFGSRERSNATDHFRYGVSSLHLLLLCYLVAFLRRNCSDVDFSMQQLKILSIFRG